MKKLSFSLLVFVLISLFLVVTLGISGRAYARWYCSHGTNARIDFGSRVFMDESRGWGLQFRQARNSGNWIQIPIPGPGGSKWGVRFIKVKFHTQSVDNYVNRIDVWNGNTMIATIDGPWIGEDQVHEVELDLGEVINFDWGLNISLNTVVNDSPAGDWFKIHGACANFVKIR